MRRREGRCRYWGISGLVTIMCQSPRPDVSPASTESHHEMQPVPVFILGLHRSGTTLLYQLLGATGCFNVLTARHVAFFDDLARPHADPHAFERRVDKRFAALGQTDRCVDAVSVGPETPEEYGFLLERLTGSRTFSASAAGALQQICETVRRDAGQQRAMLLKNPWDFGRVSVIRAALPEARFVFIHRNPFHVLSSTLRMTLFAAEKPNAYLAMLSDSYRALTQSEFPWRVAQKLALYAPGLLADWMIRDVARRACGFLRGLRRGDCDSFPQIRYEALCEDANGVISVTLDKLGFSPTDQNFSGRIGASRSSVHPLIAERRWRIVELFGAYASSFGYDLKRMADELPGESPQCE